MAPVLYYFVVLILLLFSAGSILWGINLFLQNLGTVFSAWDAVVSWNHWGTIWAAGQIPMDTRLLPAADPGQLVDQLRPAGQYGHSIFRQGTDAALHAHDSGGTLQSCTPDQEIQFSCLDLLLQFLLTNSLKNGLSSGYVDIAVAFFSFAALYILIKAHHTPDVNERGRLYILGALFSAGAAVAKQAGVYMALCYPVLVAADVTFQKSRWTAGISETG